MDQIMSEQGYGLLLTAVLEKFRPYLEAAGPAAVDAFFFQGERARAESFANFISAKEIARQEVENMTGERIPPRIAGRILLRQANLSESQREAIAIKYNALLSFEEVAVALRPLDRPEALMKPGAGATSTTLAMTSGQPYEWEYDEEHLPNEGYYEDEWPEERDGEPEDYVGGPPAPEEGAMFFEMDREYDEDEALYIWAYNDAYQQLLQESQEGHSAAYPAYSDVRKELQARRKGRQFFKPEKGKGKSRGRSSGKGHKGKKGSKGSSKGKGRSKGTTEDLMARTRCFSCGELGHFSRDCPSVADAGAGRTNFVLSQGPAPGSVNRTFMMATPKAIAVYAGVRTSAGEGLVDTAAEDAVIGSSAFERLCQTLAGQGLRPVRASGPMGACAGIGGSAQVAAVWDVPIGIAQTNGLLRVTVVTDTEGFETPFLIPISFQELVGMLIDIDKGEIRTRAGTTATMHRLPTGHRAVSVVDFKGRWALPRELLRSGRDPFQLPRASRPHAKPGPIGKHRGVTVWLRQPTGQLEYVDVLEGERKSMVLPSECLSPEVVSSLQTTRVTFLDTQPGCLPYVINDSWSNSLGPRELEEPWTGTVIFQQASSSSTATPSSDSTTPLRQAASPLGNNAAEVRRFSLSDESEMHSSAAWDFEGVFSSVSGGEQHANSSSSSVMHVHPQPPRQQDVWSQMRTKGRRVIAQLTKSTFFVNLVQRSSVGSRPMLGQLFRQCFARADHAAPNPSYGAPGAGGDHPDEAQKGLRVVPPIVGPPCRVTGSHDRHGEATDGDRRCDPDHGPTYQYGIFLDVGPNEPQAEQESAACSPRSGRADVSKPSQKHLDRAAGVVPPWRRGLADEGKPGSVLVGLPSLRIALGENTRGDCSLNQGSSHGREANLPRDRAAEAFASSALEAEPGILEPGTGSEAHPKGSGSTGYFEDYANSEESSEAKVTLARQRQGEDGATLREGDPHDRVPGPRLSVRPVRGRGSRSSYREPDGCGTRRVRFDHCDDAVRGLQGARRGQGGCTPDGETAGSYGMGRLCYQEPGPDGGGAERLLIDEALPKLTVGSESHPRPLDAPAGATEPPGDGGLRHQRRERLRPAEGQDADLLLDGGIPDTERHRSTVSPASSTRSELMMLASAPAFLQHSLAKRGYAATCGLAVLLSVASQTHPLAASTTSKLPFDRLEAGQVQGDAGDQPRDFLLFQLPETFEYHGSTCEDQACTLPRSEKQYVVANLENYLNNDDANKTWCAVPRQGNVLVGGKPGEQPVQPLKTTGHQTKSASTTTSPQPLRRQQSGLSSSFLQRQEFSAHPACSSTSALLGAAASRFALATAGHQTKSGSTTTSPQPVVQQRSGRWVVRSFPIEEHIQAPTLVDGDVQYTGDVGVRALSFMFAWPFENANNSERAVKLVKDAKPGVVALPVTGASFSTVVAVAQTQEQGGRLFMMSCSSKFKRGLFRQLPQATAVPVRFADPGKVCWILVNDKTLVRLFANLRWDQQPWPETDDESLEATITQFLHALCHPLTLQDSSFFGNRDLLCAAAQKVLPSFHNLLLAVRTNTAFVTMSAPFLGGGGTGGRDLCFVA